MAFEERRKVVRVLEQRVTWQVEIRQVLERQTHLPILLSPLRMGQTTAACVFSETSLHSKSLSLSGDFILSIHSHIKLFYLLKPVLYL